MVQTHHLEIESADDVTIVRFATTVLIDSLTLTELGDEFFAYLDRARPLAGQGAKPEKLAVDFSRVLRCSSMVINVLLQVHNKLHANGGVVALFGLPESIRNEFRMLNLEGKVFPIFSSQAQALENMGRMLPKSRFKHFQLQNHDGVVILHLTDSVMADNRTLDEFDEELHQFLDAGPLQKGANNVMVNFGSVTNCSTPAINSLLRANTKITNSGGQLKLCGMTPNIRSQFAMMDLDPLVFRIYDSAGAALQAFAEAPKI